MDNIKAWLEVVTDKASWAFFGATVGVFGWFFSTGKRVQSFKSRLQRVEENQTEIVTTLAKVNDDMKKRLYHDDGSPIYMSADTCMRSSTDCRARIEKGLDEIKSDVRELIKLHTKE